jgi:hypothetical protein
VTTPPRMHAPGPRAARTLRPLQRAAQQPSPDLERTRP